MHRLTTLFAPLLIVLALSVGAVPAHAQAAPSLAAQAEAMRTTLLQAQMALTADPEAAAAQIEAATDLYASALSPQLAADAPQVNERVNTALARAAQATAAGDSVALAAARATAWTALLHGAYQIVSAAINRGDFALAAQWLPLREYRQATRFSRPNGDVSTALAGLMAGSVTQSEALQILDADLLDTYQARLSDALRAVNDADSQGFALRRAELAGRGGGLLRHAGTCFLRPARRRRGYSGGRRFRTLGSRRSEGRVSGWAIASARGTTQRLSRRASRAARIGASRRANGALPNPCVCGIRTRREWQQSHQGARGARSGHLL